MQRIRTILLLFISTILILGGSLPTTASATPESTDTDDISIFLPLVMRPGDPILMGVETHVPYRDDVMDKTKDAGAGIIRYYGFSWEKIEPTNTNPEDYNWGAIDGSSLTAMTSRGFEVIGTIKFTPYWAQAVQGHSCGPIATHAFDDFAEFLTALVDRYSKEPYNVKYWEIGNEPDVAPNIVPPDNIYGCWGDQSDYYYGGRYYGEMLKQAYPAIKAGNSRAKLVLGSLLLDCDPSYDSSCQVGRFFEGVLVSGAADYFDYVGFHGYPNYYGNMSFDEQHPKWAHRGGIVLGKISYLRDVMANYGVNKPIMHTEGAFLCPEHEQRCEDPGDDFWESQADYVIWLYIRNWAQDIKSTIWYTIEGPGWRHGGMLDAEQQPKKAYLVFDNMNSYLNNAYYLGPVNASSDPDFRGYEFANNSSKIWVVWSVDETSGTNITLPAGYSAIYDKYGDVVTPGGSVINIQSPIYIELPK